MQSSTNIVHDPYAAAEDAHGSLNPSAHKWADRHSAERFVLAFARFEDCDTRDSTTVETIVGRERDGTWAREWLFQPENPDSRGWRAQQLEFIEEIRTKLEPGDILVMELGAERPTLDNPDRKTRPFKASHHPASAVGNGLASDEQTETRDNGAADNAPPF